jgi:hypothetical protein
MKHLLCSIYWLTLFFSVLPEIRAQEKIDGKDENPPTQLTPKISGTLNMRYQYNDADGSNSFDIRRARLDFKGDIVSSIDYRIHVEFAGNPKIIDAYINWRSTSALNIKAGEFKIPFSLENPYSAHALEMVDNSMVIIGLSGYNDISGISANGRDIGVTVYGKFSPVGNYHIFEYSAGLFNGNGINVADNNKSKDFSGIFIVHPSKDLTLSASYYNGSTRRQDENIQRIRTGGGVRYDDNKLLVRGEYISGITGDMDSEGYYLVAGYFVHPKVQTLLKYDYFERDTSVKETRHTNYILGVNYFPFKNFHFKLNCSRRTAVGATDSNHVVLQLSAIF